LLKVSQKMLSFFPNLVKTLPQIISLVGAGGKTSIMFDLAKAFKQHQLRVLVTTTTKIYFPEPYLYDDLFYVKIPDFFSPQSKSITVAGSSFDQSTNKIIGFDFKTIQQLVSMFDVVLIEADGSKQKDLKYPKNDEPLIHPDSTLVIGVIGLNCLGKPINAETVHRHLLFTESLGYFENQIIQLNMLFDLINSPTGLFKNTPQESQKICVLNQLDEQQDITTIKSRIDQAEKTFSKIAELYLSGIKRNQRYWIKPYIQED
jgi:probable selenium-dependent hydroxylase accessory protein YqeC